MSALAPHVAVYLRERLPAELGASRHTCETYTHALLPGSPAIDQGDPTLLAGEGDVEKYDQRGDPFGRVFDADGDGNAFIDMGAFEFQSVVVFTLVGDYNSNGTVDAADYTVLRDTMGSTTDMRADGNGNHVIDEGDFLMWRSHFGEVMPLGGGAAAASASAQPVPAPSATATVAPILEAEVSAQASAVAPVESAEASFSRQVGGQTSMPAFDRTEAVATANHVLPLTGPRQMGPVGSAAAPLAHVLPSQGPRQDQLLLAWLASLDSQYPSTGSDADAFVFHQAADNRLSDCEAVDELFDLWGQC